MDRVGKWERPHIFAFCDFGQIAKNLAKKLNGVGWADKLVSVKVIVEFEHPKNFGRPSVYWYYMWYLIIGMWPSCTNTFFNRKQCIRTIFTPRMWCRSYRHFVKKVCAFLKGIPECTVSDNHLALQSKLTENWQTFRVTGTFLLFVDSSL